MGGNSWQYRYDTGWINCSDWTNRHLGSDTTLNADSNVTHNLNTLLSNLLVKVYISTDGTDATASEMINMANNSAGSYGIILFQVDNNNITVQTGINGLAYMDTAGTYIVLDTENYYYKVKVWYLG